MNPDDAPRPYAVAGPVAFAQALTTAELGDPPVLHNARYLLAAAAATPIKATATSGNLARRFVEQAFVEMRWPAEYADDVRRYNKVIDEPDLTCLMLLRVALQNGGLLRKRNGCFHATRRARELLAAERVGELYAEVFTAYFEKTNLGFLDGMADDEAMQHSLPFTFERLHDDGHQWMTLPAFAELVVADEALWMRVERQTRFPDRQWAVTLRLVDPLVEFGLLELVGTTMPSRPGQKPDAKLRTTELFHRFVVPSADLCVPTGALATSHTLAAATSHTLPSASSHAPASASSRTLAAAIARYLRLRPWRESAITRRDTEDALEIYAAYVDGFGYHHVAARDRALVESAMRFSPDNCLTASLPPEHAIVGIKCFFEDFLLRKTSLATDEIMPLARALGVFFEWLAGCGELSQPAAAAACAEAESGGRRAEQASDLCDLLGDRVRFGYPGEEIGIAADTDDYVDADYREGNFRVAGSGPGSLELSAFETGDAVGRVEEPLLRAGQVPNGWLISGVLRRHQGGWRFDEVWSVYPG